MGKGDFSFDEFCRVISEFSSCMDDYPYVIDLKNDKYFISEKALQRFAIPSSLFTDVMNTHKKFVDARDYQLLAEDLEKLQTGKKNIHNLEYRWLDKEKRPVWINCRGRVLADDDGIPEFMIGCINEIGLEARADNISGFLQSIAMRDYIADADKMSDVGFILRIGVDGFKNISESFGNQYGNIVLKSVADCIRKCTNENQVVYHIVADEFMILDISRKSKLDSIYELYRNIKRELEMEIEKNNFETVYTISGGIISVKEMENPEYADIMKYSEFALGEAKNRGRNQVYVFEQEDYDLFLRKRKILAQLRKSVGNDFEGFDLVFQPIMTAGEDGVKLYAAESLLRFTTATGEFISPMEFVPLLEESGLIIPVGKWILDRAVSMCKKCQEYYPDFKVSINLSYVQILKSAILNDVFNSIAQYGIKPDSIIMEMTESGYLEDTMIVKRVWDSLKKFGVLIAIDDFGTGYSNLSSISRLTPDIVKIDRGFTVKALKHKYENQLMENIIELVHSIDLKICLEGVETNEELKELNRLNPNYIQGYYYSRPCKRQEFFDRFILHKDENAASACN